MLISVQNTDTAGRCSWLVFMTDLILMLTAFQIADNSRPDLWIWSWVWVLAQRDRLLDDHHCCLLWSLCHFSLLSPLILSILSILGDGRIDVDLGCLWYYIIKRKWNFCFSEMWKLKPYVLLFCFLWLCHSLMPDISLVLLFVASLCLSG